MTEELERVPAPSSPLQTAMQDLASTVWTGAPIPETSRDVLQCVFGDFINKTLMMNMVSVAHLQSRMPHLMKGLALMEDFVYDPTYLAGVSASAELAHDYYKLFRDSIHKTIEVSTEFCKDVSASMDKGFKPREHLEWHAISPTCEVEFPQQSSPESRRRVARLYEKIVEVIDEKTAAEEPLPPPRLFDSDKVPPEPDEHYID